jgi:hypothetical protein
MSSERLDLSSEPPRASTEDATPDRSYLGIHFACCGVYSRIYRNAEQTAYAGHCPRCTRRVKVNIAPGGTNQRFFTVY